eukprot:gb/GEZN01030619.1/.p1 GENE.gb/GEZN01030619.1/~~gb/GEZN01030619.1/.p1  ORF type:complete len:125 (+),score=20.67 gb/GEZN01030619.1/:40-414(+)
MGGVRGGGGGGGGGEGGGGVSARSKYRMHSASASDGHNDLTVEVVHPVPVLEITPPRITHSDSRYHLTSSTSAPTMTVLPLAFSPKPSGSPLSSSHTLPLPDQQVPLGGTESLSATADADSPCN